MFRKTTENKIKEIFVDQIGFRRGQGKRNETWNAENNIGKNFGNKRRIVCLLYRMTENI
jgi:hypothetical protein